MLREEEEGEKLQGESERAKGAEGACMLYTSSEGEGSTCWRWERTAPHGCHARYTWHPFRHLGEQVAGAGGDMVGSQFGPLTGRIRYWAKNEVCSPRPALHFPLRYLGHWSNRSVGN